MGLFPDGSITHQTLETVLAKQISKSFQIIVTKLVDRHQQNQARACIGGSGCWTSSLREHRQHEENDE
jgi:hypothetical protein